MTRLSKLLLALATLSLIAGACANDDSSSDDSSGATTTEAADAGVDETTTTTAATDAGTDDDSTTTTAAPVPDGPHQHLARALAGEFEGTEVEILGQWVEAESDGFKASLAALADTSGIDIKYEGVTDYETVLAVRADGGDPPDLAQIAQPGLMRTFASEGKLVPISEWINMDQLNEDYISSFVDLGSADDGNTYGVFYKTDIKSIVWYPVAAFEENGYSVPATWDELTALSDQIIADGNGNPWCVSIEHGDASGWVATDWMEDVLLRTAPTDIYDRWITHDIEFNHPEVLEAAAIVGDVWFADDYVFGANTGINSIWVGDTQTPMFAEAGPQCWMHKQAAWIPGFWPKDADDNPLYTPGVDSSFFYLPPIESDFGSPVLGGGDQIVMFNDRPEVRAVLEFLASAEGAKGWIEAGGFLSPNRSVPTAWYTAYPQNDLAEIMASATTFRFDASDTMPAEVGNGTFWSGMVDWVSANGDNTEDVFADIEASWPAS